MFLKPFISIICLLFFSVGRAQDSVIVLSTSMYDKNFQVIRLTATDGWIFKKGNDTNWAKKDIATDEWKRFNPTQLTAKNADKNGRVEGWFRIRIRLDSSFKDQSVGIQLGRWAATDAYIDGNHTVSAGNTGLNGKSFEENPIYIAAPTGVDLDPGVDYLIALHLVDYVSPLKSTLLKTEMVPSGYRNVLEITGPDSVKNDIQYYKKAVIYWTLWVSVCSLLAIVFWFLYFQDRSFKNLLLVAIATTSFSIAILLDAIFASRAELSFTAWAGFYYTKEFLYAVAQATGILFLAHAFQRKISILLLLLLVIVVFSGVVGEFYFDVNLQIPRGILFLLTCLYFIFTSWKNLKGAQWALVAGILSTCVWNLLLAYNTVKYSPAFPFPFAFMYITGTFLSFPLSQLVYVVMRFREILNEVQVNAKQVIQLTEEKKEQAINQQKLLEAEVARQTVELRNSLENLRTTQGQLIHSEKMASLGELTAGIAHEIQNPLNFVNNFSDVNRELLTEMKSEIDKGNLQDAKAIANDVMDNEEKINHHGKRAEAIVKGMLQHSRTGSGQKEPTDINALADEYLRLAYHGLRAKDKSFSAKFETNFDKRIGEINIVSQDMGRVILNLINNAFYTVNEKQKTYQSSGGVPYEPTVTVITAKQNGKVEIKVKDNGRGISQKVLDKIFQPFFTTKPAGQGTGLGLSMAYDIVTKGHNGKFEVHTKEGEGSEFIIQLPIS